MNDAICPFDGLSKAFFVPDVALDEFETLIGEKWQNTATSAQKTVIGHDIVAFFEKPGGQSTAYIASAAGNQNSDLLTCSVRTHCNLHLSVYVK